MAFPSQPRRHPPDPAPCPHRLQKAGSLRWCVCVCVRVQPQGCVFSCAHVRTYISVGTRVHPYTHFTKWPLREDATSIPRRSSPPSSGLWLGHWRGPGFRSAPALAFSGWCVADRTAPPPPHSRPRPWRAPLLLLGLGSSRQTRMTNNVALKD